MDICIQYWPNEFLLQNDDGTQTTPIGTAIQRNAIIYFIIDQRIIYLLKVGREETHFR